MVPTSPPPTLDDFVPATTSGSGIHRRSAARSAKPAASISRCHATSCPRAVSARATRSSSGGSAGRGPSGRTASMRPPSGGRGEEADQAAGARAPSAAAAARSASTLMTSRSALRRSKPAASPAASRRARTPARSRSRSRLSASSRSRACSTHNLVNTSRRSARSRRTCSSARLALASTRADAALASSSTPAGHGQRLRHHHHVFRHAGDRFPVERDPRIRPAARHQHLGPHNVDASSRRQHARTLGRELRQRLRFGQGHHLSARARRHQDGDQHGTHDLCAHTTSIPPHGAACALGTPDDSKREKTDGRRVSPSDQDRKAGGARDASDDRAGGS